MEEERDSQKDLIYTKNWLSLHLGFSQINLGLHRTPQYLLRSGFDLPVSESFLQDGQVSTQELQGEKHLLSEHSPGSLFKQAALCDRQGTTPSPFPATLISEPQEIRKLQGENSRRFRNKKLAIFRVILVLLGIKILSL